MADRRSYVQRREYLIRAVKKRRHTLRQKAIMLKGGKCYFCGYNRESSALEFHHLDEDTKKFGLSERGLTHSWQKISQELDKCILVCANCHRELHAGILQLPVETLE